MNDTNINSDRSEEILQMLISRGLLEDPQIIDSKVRKAVKTKKRNMYHNTQLMLRHYRDINWALECFPSTVADELDKPLNDLDSLLSLIDAEIGMDNTRLDGRLMSVQKSRLLLDRLNAALTMLRHKPNTGELMYQSLYLSYIAPECLSHNEILYRLNISSRHYYRIRQQAINILSIQLWATPAAELDSWLEILAILEAI